ncbi:hypothetical protein HD553DRAFT_187253 [Filobasidium floriforme]|uniref:uncharacterized protein n=1 Tax=Filobasidium floriforme TaxID=5210 RepID=UPI001E8E1C28|nr:uncharacterized protein HD553DRAFT_187253 [Filobasidium floriforme]KAH8088052.1 hypothetical protein HD553DRAFT_187253 [Filobasidium floriforme]
MLGEDLDEQHRGLNGPFGPEEADLDDDRGNPLDFQLSGSRDVPGPARASGPVPHLVALYQGLKGKDPTQLMPDQVILMYYELIVDAGDDVTWDLWLAFANAAKGTPAVANEKVFKVTDGDLVKLAPPHRFNLRDDMCHRVLLRNGRVVPRMALVLGLMQHFNPLLAERIVSGQSVSPQDLATVFPAWDRHKQGKGVGVYALVCSRAHPAKTYIGMTCQSFAQRIETHRQYGHGNHRLRAEKERVDFQDWLVYILVDFGPDYRGSALSPTIINAMEIGLIVMLGTTLDGQGLNERVNIFQPCYMNESPVSRRWLRQAWEKIWRVTTSPNGLRIPTGSRASEEQVGVTRNGSPFVDFLERIGLSGCRSPVGLIKAIKMALNGTLPRRAATIRELQSKWPITHECFEINRRVTPKMRTRAPIESESCVGRKERTRAPYTDAWSPTYEDKIPEGDRWVWSDEAGGIIPLIRTNAPDYTIWAASDSEKDGTAFVFDPST